MSSKLPSPRRNRCHSTISRTKGPPPCAVDKAAGQSSERACCTACFNAFTALDSCATAPFDIARKGKSDRDKAPIVCLNILLMGKN
ncbi:hypothetical protein GCM10016455_27610 [Aliiroseovarius zhejiangensis]|uniref:Uncharacterized protein n=1 Tax=Aliiroseovarius zhejiangensis TaxID=1632025 RepID=A0ABQ3J8Q8_9RHOB|nr:hypothetical protein GCM10016455_27610 [Aliiroseovarius zhejiangensis]